MRDSTIFLYCASDPLIENCKKLVFAPYNYCYAQLEEHTKTVGFDVSTNRWDKIIDQSADAKNPMANYSILDYK